MKQVLRLMMLALQPLPSPQSGLSCYLSRELSSKDKFSPAQLTARSSRLPARPQAVSSAPPDWFSVPAGGRSGAIKYNNLIHECTGICACIQDQNTDRYIQICTECKSAYVYVLSSRNAYLHVFRIKIQTDTCRYALDAWVHMCMYSVQKYSQIWTPPESAYLYISARMWVEYIWHTDTYAQDTEHRKAWYRHIQADTAMCICHMHSLYPICTWLYRVHMSVHICMYLFQIHTRYISSYPCCICMYFW